MILTFFLLFTAFSLSAEEFFHSDGLGMQGEALPGMEKTGWVLELSQGGNIRTLYQDGEEHKRWEIQEFPELRDSGAQEIQGDLREERYFYKGLLRSREICNTRGQVEEEYLYDSSGVLIQEKHYSYSPQGQLEKMEGAGNWSQEMVYRPDGTLRAIISEGSRVDWRASNFSRSYLDDFYVRESVREKEQESRFRYDGPRLVEKTTTLEGKLLEGTKYVYNEEGFLEKEIFSRPGENIRKIRTFNGEGQLLTVEEFQDELLVGFEECRYEKGRLKSRCKQDSSIRRRWDYEYKGEDTEPWKIRSFVNGKEIEP